MLSRPEGLVPLKLQAKLSLSSLKLQLVRRSITAMRKQLHQLDRDQARVTVKQYSFFNSPLQMEAPELIPTPTPTRLPGDLQRQGPCLNLVERGGLPLPVMAYLKKILVT